MSIEKITNRHGTDYNLYCDICGELVMIYGSMQEAIQGKKDCGMKRVRDEIDGAWLDICEDCQSEEDEDE